MLSTIGIIMTTLGGLLSLSNWILAIRWRRAARSNPRTKRHDGTVPWIGGVLLFLGIFTLCSIQQARFPALYASLALIADYTCLPLLLSIGCNIICSPGKRKK